MRRGPLTWILAGVGVLLVLLVTLAIGARDNRDEPVEAGEWAQNVCGSVAVWRGELEAIVEDIRTPPSAGGGGSEEPQSETPQGRTGFVRVGLERAVQATETMIEGIDNAGIPDTPQGEEAAGQVDEWAGAALENLEEAEDALDEEADTLEGSIEQLTEVVAELGSALAGGVQAVVDVARVDPALAAALRGSSTCMELQEERGA